MTKSHYLRGPAKDWTPPVVISFDTETVERTEGDRLVHTMLCWAAKRRVRDPGFMDDSHTRTADGLFPAELADFVEAETRWDTETWCVAHNLGFDLATSSLPFILAARGWYVKDLHLGDESCWWSLTRDGRKIVLTDSWSWLRCSLDDAAKDVKKRKVPLPDDSDPMASWLGRCRTDVEILDRVMCEVLDWWDGHQLGRFGISGAGCGVATMRTHLEPRRLVVGPDGKRTPFERKALYGGRQEVYRVGVIRGSWSADYDLADAYLTMALLHRLPRAHLRRLEVVPQSFLASDVGPTDVIANCTITTDRPVAPCRIGVDVWWPTGTFTTTLTGPELRYVASTGATVELGEGEEYRVDATLSSWAQWCLELVNDTHHDTPPVIRRIAKGWARSVIGRFAARTSRLLHERPATELGWKLVTGNDLATGAGTDILSMDGVERTTIRDVEPDDGAVAITAFVEGWCRATLGQILDSRDPSRLIQCNTDGWWEHKAVRDAGVELDCPVEGVTIVRKRVTAELTMLGANHTVTPEETKLAGVSGDATSTDGQHFAWHDWPSLRWQLEHGALGEFHRPPHALDLAASYVRRWVLRNGETVPVTTAVEACGSIAILPWSQTIGARPDDVLAEHQDPALAALLFEHPEQPTRESPPSRRPPGRFRPRDSARPRRAAAKLQSETMRRLFPIS